MFCSGVVAYCGMLWRLGECSVYFGVLWSCGVVLWLFFDVQMLRGCCVLWCYDVVGLLCVVVCF